MILKFVILFAKYYIYNCKKNGMPIDFFSFLVKWKSRLIIEEYRHRPIMYNRGLEFATKWSILCDLACECIHAKNLLLLVFTLSIAIFSSMFYKLCHT